MTQSTYDILGIGNAIVDVIAPADDEFLHRLGLPKGGMSLIDAGQAVSLYAAMAPARESSGGSAANTVAGLASLGGKGAFIGKVRDDLLGLVFRHDITALGVAFPTPASVEGPPTARCLILVTPDAQRTMNTFLGASADLGPEDIDADIVAASQVTYLEGYLFDPPRAQAAFRQAAGIAHRAGRKVGLSLSDAFCVERHRAEFRDLIENHVDILFANEAEITALYQTHDFDLAAQTVRGQCEIAVLTRSAQGSLIVTKDAIHRIEAAKIGKLVDTTGAGDLYAGGFLFGLTHGMSLPDCGRLGSLCAAEIISHVGARPEVSLKELVAKAGLV